MTQKHPITPPPELVEEWFNNSPIDRGLTLATKAAQWGADMELEACVNWLADPCAADMPSLAKDLRYSRRPKPPSLAKRALHILGTHGDLSCTEHDTIRCALEALDE